MREILVDEYGYKQFFEELEKLKQLSLSNASAGSEAYNDAVGDGWHDNFAFEESMRESRTIASKIDKMLKEQQSLRIVDSKNLGDEFINIGDSFEAEIKYAEDDIEIEKLTLTGKYKPDTELKIKEISLNSPIGKAVFQKRINSSVSYIVNDREINVNILNKLQ